MESRIFVQTVRQNGRTRVEDMYFTAPYQIMRPLYNGGHTDLILMAASAGLLAGDSVQAQYRFGEGSDVTVRTQGFEKVFNTGSGSARRQIDLEVGAEARVCFLPQPVIPFAGSDYRGSMTVFLHKDSRFLCADVFTCGRTGCGERFAMRRFENRLFVTLDGRPVFAEHTLVQPEKHRCTGPGQWQEFTHQGVLYAYAPGKEEEILAFARQENMLPEGMVGASRAVCGVCVRALAMSGDTLFRFFERFAALIQEK